MTFRKTFDFFNVPWEPQTPMILSSGTWLKTTIIRPFLHFFVLGNGLFQIQTRFLYVAEQVSTQWEKMLPIKQFFGIAQDLAQLWTEDGAWWQESLSKWARFSVVFLVTDHWIYGCKHPRSVITDLNTPTCKWLTEQSGNRERKAERVDMKRFLW